MTIQKENPHSGWFNIDKVELVAEYPTIINRIHQDELKNKFNLGLSEIDTKYLFDPVICHMSGWMRHAIVKDLDKKVMNGIKERLL